MLRQRGGANHEKELTDEQEEEFAPEAHRKHARAETPEDHQWLTRINNSARQYGALKMSTPEGQLQRKQTELQRLDVYRTARDRWFDEDGPNERRLPPRRPRAPDGSITRAQYAAQLLVPTRSLDAATLVSRAAADSTAASPSTAAAPMAASSSPAAAAAAAAAVATTEIDNTNLNDDRCDICKTLGELVCCDKCPHAYHESCLAVHWAGAQYVLDHLADDEQLTCAKLRLRCTARKDRWIRPAGMMRVIPPDGTVVWLQHSDLSNPAYKDFFTEAMEQLDESYESLVQEKWSADVLLITGKGMLRVVSHRIC